MFPTLAILSALTTVALAQSPSSAAANATSTANPLIPTTLAPSCVAFLQTLNTDTTLATCLKAVSDATSAFQPGSTTTPSSANVNSALSSLCSDSVNSACPQPFIRSKIADFYSACADDIQKKVPEVITPYDVLYTLTPLRQSICSKDDSGTYCVMAAPTTSREADQEPATGASDSLTLAQMLGLLYTNNGAALKRRAPATAILPNMTTYHDSNLPFLFNKPEMDATTLCTSCTRQILTAYINFESNIPYAPGLGASQLLDTQTDLYNAIKDKCPAGFMSQAVQAAGGLSGGILPSGAVPAVNAEFKVFTAFAMGVASLVYAL
ncbi:hypothetical protein CVT24_010084 [Panaeolus cyanescens]|uniref:DUF7729 domain-containing protein n=1 Tax=Panaeolus cyanescens TaxID=181874 RepID=A0A409YQ17_9AGAR|nr:hypothetical protein CVT24_010084 [Panaeolus cyanescens]